MAGQPLPGALMRSGQHHCLARRASMNLCLVRHVRHLREVSSLKPRVERLFIWQAERRTLSAFKSEFAPQLLAKRPFKLPTHLPH